VIYYVNGEHNADRDEACKNKISHFIMKYFIERSIETQSPKTTVLTESPEVVKFSTMLAEGSFPHPFLEQNREFQEPKIRMSMPMSSPNVEWKTMGNEKHLQMKQSEQIYIQEALRQSNETLPFSFQHTPQSSKMPMTPQNYGSNLFRLQTGKNSSPFPHVPQTETDIRSVILPNNYFSSQPLTPLPVNSSFTQFTLQNPIKTLPFSSRNLPTPKSNFIPNSPIVKKPSVTSFNSSSIKIQKNSSAFLSPKPQPVKVNNLLKLESPGPSPREKNSGFTFIPKPPPQKVQITLFPHKNLHDSSRNRVYSFNAPKNISPFPNNSFSFNK